MLGTWLSIMYNFHLVQKFCPYLYIHEHHMEGEKQGAARVESWVPVGIYKVSSQSLVEVPGFFLLRMGHLGG